MVLPFPHSLPPLNLLFTLIIFFGAHAYFCLVLECKNIVLWPSKATMCFLLFFVNHFDGPNDKISSHSTLITQLIVHLPLIYCFCWLLVGCCVSLHCFAAVYSHGVYFFIFVHCSIHRSKQPEYVLPTHSAPMVSYLKCHRPPLPTQFLVSCHVFLFVC